MQSIQLSVDRSKMDASFEGYKVSMDNVHFESKKLEQNLCLRAPSNQMVTLQHMKVFSNDNQLFSDSTKSTETHQYLYRILDTGHIQQLVYDKKTRQWDTSIVGNIEIEKSDVAFPTNLLFTDKNLIVACNGTTQISVFLSVSGGTSNWVNMLSYKVSEQPGISLIEARVQNDKLNILAYQVESENEKKTKSRIYWITVKLDDMDYAETLTIEKTTEFVQNGHFETCTFTNDGDIIFLSSEKPHVVGHEDVKEESVIKPTWIQTDNIIQITFQLTSPISEEDVNIDVTKTGIRLDVKDVTLLSGKLDGEIDENDVEICADQKTNTLVLKLKTTEDKKWGQLIAMETSTLEVLEDAEIKKMAKEEQVFGAEEAMEECDEADGALLFYWVDQTTDKVVKQCDVTGSQVLFTRRDCISPAVICLRHDVDGILWSFDDAIPRHVATLQAFGYVQASKTTRLWSGCSPNNSLACIVEGNNRVLLYSQKVEISGNLSNRKTSQTVSHVAKQHLLRVECSDPVRGVQLTDSHLFAATKEHIHVAELAL